MPQRFLLVSTHVLEESILSPLCHLRTPHFLVLGSLSKLNLSLAYSLPNSQTVSPSQSCKHPDWRGMGTARWVAKTSCPLCKTLSIFYFLRPLKHTLCCAVCVYWTYILGQTGVCQEAPPSAASTHAMDAKWFFLPLSFACCLEKRWLLFHTRILCRVPFSLVRQCR